MQVIRSRETYDAIVVGSGAGGGMAAKVLTESGARVLMLEAGVNWDPVNESYMMMWPYESPRRGGGTDYQQFGEFDACFGGFSLDGEPYTVARGDSFGWFRARMLGGRTNHWGRISLRFGPDDFRKKSLDGLGDDWPIGYDDIRPYYDQVDELIGLFGSAEGMPNEPDGIFMPPPAPRCWEQLIKGASDRLDIPCIPSRLSIITRPHNGREACHYCGQCFRGCMIHANFSSPSVLLPPAMATGRLTIRTDAMAREVTVGADGRATGVLFIDKTTGREEHVQARTVVLAASACESARILLNSTSSQFPQGLANSSGTVGKYLMDTTGVSVGGFIPQLMDGIPHNEDGVGGAHLYMPWWLDNRTLDFPRGYHIEISGGRGMPMGGYGGGIQGFSGYDNGREVGGYGTQLKEEFRRFYGSTVGLAGRGEMVANENCYCEIDPTTVDRWGIPVLRFHFQWSDHERNQARHMQQTFRAIIEEMGGTPMGSMPGRSSDFGLAAGGRIIHELGVTRMGNDPSTSVLDTNCQAHDVPNLFVADGGPFVSQPEKNPTWTILALAWRTSDFIASQLRSGSL